MNWNVETIGWLAAAFTLGVVTTAIILALRADSMFATARRYMEDGKRLGNELWQEHSKRTEEVFELIEQLQKARRVAEGSAARDPSDPNPLMKDLEQSLRDRNAFGKYVYPKSPKSGES